MEFLSPEETLKLQKKRAMNIVNKALVNGCPDRQRCISLQEIPHELYRWVKQELEAVGWIVVELNEKNQWITIEQEI